MISKYLLKLFTFGYLTNRPANGFSIIFFIFNTMSANEWISHQRKTTYRLNILCQHVDNNYKGKMISKLCYLLVFSFESFEQMRVLHLNKIIRMLVVGSWMMSSIFVKNTLLCDNLRHSICDLYSEIITWDAKRAQDNIHNGFMQFKYIVQSIFSLKKFYCWSLIYLAKKKSLF